MTVNFGTKYVLVGGLAPARKADMILDKLKSRLVALLTAFLAASAIMIGEGAWASPTTTSTQARIFGELRHNTLQLGGTAALPLSLPSRSRVAFVAAPAGMAGLPGFPGATVLRGNAQSRDILEVRIDHPDHFPGGTGEVNVLGLRAGTFQISVVVLLVDGRKVVDRVTIVVRAPGSAGAARPTTTMVGDNQPSANPNQFRSGFDLPATSGPVAPTTFRSIPAALVFEMRGVKSLAEKPGLSPSYGVGRAQARFSLGRDDEDPTGSFQLLAGYKQVGAALDERAPRDLQGDWSLAPELGLGYQVGTWAFGLTAGPVITLQGPGMHARPAIVSIAAENGDTSSVASIRSIEANTDFADARFRAVGEYTPVRWGGFSAGLQGLVEGTVFSGAAKDGSSDIAAGIGPELRLRTNFAGLPGELFIGGGPLWQGSGQGLSVSSHGGWRMWLKPQAATPVATAAPAGGAQ